MSRAALVLLSCSTLMGCILTRDPTYDAPANTPAVVLEDPGTPMNRFYDVCWQCRTDDGGVPTQVPFVALVRDPDVAQDLEGRVFVDHDPNASSNTPVINEIRLPATGELVRRVEFQVDMGSIPLGCPVVELHIARSFINITNPVPAPDPVNPDAPLDLGRGVWFMRVLSNDDDDPRFRGCEPD